MGKFNNTILSTIPGNIELRKNTIDLRKNTY